jgi:hypothetical protein
MITNEWIWEKDVAQTLHHGMYRMMTRLANKVPAEMFKLMAEAWPAGVKGKNGNTPLHLGMLFNAPAEVIKLLVDACPESVKVKNKDGNSPLHNGMQHKATPLNA